MIKKYRLIQRTLYEIIPNGQLVAVTKVPDHINTLAKALEYLELDEQDDDDLFDPTELNFND